MGCASSAPHVAPAYRSASAPRYRADGGLSPASRAINSPAPLAYPTAARTMQVSPKPSTTYALPSSNASAAAAPDAFSKAASQLSNTRSQAMSTSAQFTHTSTRSLSLAAQAVPSVRTISMAEVARHNTRQDCWLVINRKVFDATSFLNSHPGGPSVILIEAGRDATAAFQLQHPYLRPDSFLQFQGVVA